MIHPQAVVGPIEPHDPLAAWLHLIDAGDVRPRAAGIGTPLDVVVRLAGEMAAEAGSGAEPRGAARQAGPPG